MKLFFLSRKSLLEIRDVLGEKIDFARAVMLNPLLTIGNQVGIITDLCVGMEHFLESRVMLLDILHDLNWFREVMVLAFVTEALSRWANKARPVRDVQRTVLGRAQVEDRILLAKLLPGGLHSF